jgi:type II secretory pathway component PulK
MQYQLPQRQQLFAQGWWVAMGAVAAFIGVFINDLSHQPSRVLRGQLLKM